MIKSTGIVRKIDRLGRIVLPSELRKTLDLQIDDSAEIYTDGQSIILKKLSSACIFCGDASNIIKYNGKNICKDCIKNINKKINI